jgi:hypothetical protein
MKAILLLAAGFALSGCAQVSGGYAQKAHQGRLQQALGAYEQARQGGDMLGMCVGAKLVAVAYADAGDGANSGAWFSREKEDCRAAMAAYGVTSPAIAEED